MNSKIIFITHPEVAVEPATKITDWQLSPTGRHRMKEFATVQLLNQVAAIYSSSERKAKEGAEIIATMRQLTVQIDPQLGEVDRSVTGYIPPSELQAVVRAFYSRPSESIRGRERAIDAQSRIVNAISTIAAQDRSVGDIAIVSHGAVGCLLMAHLLGRPISQDFQQPTPDGGSFLLMDRNSMSMLASWEPFEAALAI